MMTPTAAAVVCFVVFALVSSVVIIYTLRNKGDVHAGFEMDRYRVFVRAKEKKADKP